MLFHEPLDAGQLGGRKPAIGGRRHGAQPELGLQLLAGHMNVGRLLALATVKVKTIRADAQHGGHGGKFG